MTKLLYDYWCNHLTEVGCTWRREDYDARVIVKGLKQEEFKGYLSAKIGKVDRQFDKDNIEELIKLIMPAIGRALRDDIKEPISIVPIPNSGMAVDYSGPFRSVELARMVATGYGDGASFCPAIRWDSPRSKSHQSHDYRHPDLYEPHMVLVEKPKSPIVLFDDVLTSGSQMIAAARLLTKLGLPPGRGLVVAKATKLQLDGPLYQKRQGELELSEEPIEFDDF